MPHLLLDDPIQLLHAGWEEYVLQHADGCFFQTPQAYRLFAETGGYEPLVVGLIDENTRRIKGVFVSVLQQENTIYRTLTRRSIAWGAPLTGSPDDSLELLKAYDIRLRHKAIYSQIRNLSSQSETKTPFEAIGYRYKSHLNSIVSTKGRNESELLTAMSKSRARQIRKGLEKASIAEAVTEQEFLAYHSILSRLYKNKVGKPLPPTSFFKAFRETIIPNGYGKLFLVKIQNEVIGGILCAVMPGKAIYEWYIAGLDDEYREIYPSVLATWAAIRHAANAGLDHFDFLGAGSPDSAYGVREFKERFGGETVEYGRFEKVHHPVLMKIGTFGIRMKQWIR
jgi:hypothetical protein